MGWFDWLKKTSAPAPAASRDLSDTRGMQAALSDIGYLDPPPDGVFGSTSTWALMQFCKDNALPYAVPLTDQVRAALRAAKSLPLNPGADLAGRVVRAMQKHGYFVARFHDCFNIVYIEGMNPDGTVNDNKPNQFNDTRMLIQCTREGVPQIVGRWEATTEPGVYWTQNPMNPAGAARIKFGQYKAWGVGSHRGTHEALVQVAPVTVYRDANEDFTRAGDVEDTGMFGINQHWGYDNPRTDLRTSSAGCLVGRSTDGHREFMAKVKSDPRYLANHSYRFMSTIMPVADVVGA